MLRVDVVLEPGGDRKRARKLGTVCIANVSELAEVSDYEVWMAGDEDATRRIVRGHRRSEGWEPLVARALSAMSMIAAGRKAKERDEDNRRAIAERVANWFSDGIESTDHTDITGAKSASSRASTAPSMSDS